MKLFAINSLSGVVQAIVAATVTLVSIPVIIHAIGQEDYGIYCLVSIIGSLNSFSNLGINSALTRYISSQGKSIESHYDIWVALLTVTLVGVLVAFAVISFKDMILLQLLSIPANSITKASPLLIFMTISNVVLLIGQIFTASLDGLSRIYLTSFTQMIYSIVYWGGMAFLTSAGYGIEYVGVPALGAAVVWLLLVLYYFFKNWGSLQYRGIALNFTRIFKKQLEYSLKLYASGFIGFFYEPLTKIVISHYVGVSETGYYDLALRVKGQLAGIWGRILSPLYPYYAKKCGHISQGRVNKSIQECLLLLLLPAAIIIVFIAFPLTQVWLDLHIPQVAFGIAGLATAYLLFSVPVIPPYHYMGACGHPEVLIYAQAANVMINLFLLVVFLPIWGFYAIILGNMGAIFGSFILILLFQWKILKKMPFNSIRDGLNLALLGGVCIISALIIDMMIQAPLMKLFIIPTGIFLIAGALLTKLKILHSEELLVYTEDLPFLNSLLKALAK